MHGGLGVVGVGGAVCFEYFRCVSHLFCALSLPFRVACPVFTSFLAQPQLVQLGTGDLWHEHQLPYTSVPPMAQLRAHQTLLLNVTLSHLLRDSLAHFSPKVKTRAGPGQF